MVAESGKMAKDVFRSVAILHCKLAR